MIERERRDDARHSIGSRETPTESLTTRRLSQSRSMSEASTAREVRSQGSGLEEAQIQVVQTNIPDSSPLVSSLPFNNLVIAQDEDSFVFQPVPLGHRIQCKVIRKRQNGALYPEYEVYLEGTAGSKFFLLSAKRTKKIKGATYEISLNKLDSEAFDEGIVAKVKPNFLGTLFRIYDAKRKDRHEQGAVIYEPNILGLNGPRKLTLLLPGLTNDGKIKPMPYKKGKCQLYEQFKGDEITKIIVMRNKEPQWNEETQSYVLNFYNRVSQASVKNFQMVPDFDIDYIVMQFGRVGLDVFTMDFQYPLSAIQAFGITLTSFGPKLACE